MTHHSSSVSSSLVRISDFHSEDAGSNPAADTKLFPWFVQFGLGRWSTKPEIRVRVPSRGPSYGVVAERQRHFTVYEDQVGSTPIHFAKLWGCRQAAKPADSLSANRGFESRRPCQAWVDLVG